MSFWSKSCQAEGSGQQPEPQPAGCLQPGPLCAAGGRDHEEGPAPGSLSAAADTPSEAARLGLAALAPTTAITANGARAAKGAGNTAALRAPRSRPRLPRPRKGDRRPVRGPLEARGPAPCGRPAKARAPTAPRRPPPASRLPPAGPAVAPRRSRAGAGTQGRGRPRCPRPAPSPLPGPAAPPAGRGRTPPAAERAAGPRAAPRNGLTFPLPFCEPPGALSAILPLPALSPGGEKASAEPRMAAEGLRPLRACSRAPRRRRGGLRRASGARAPGPPPLLPCACPRGGRCAPSAAPAR